MQSIISQLYCCKKATKLELYSMNWKKDCFTINYLKSAAPENPFKLNLSI